MNGRFEQLAEYKFVFLSPHQQVSMPSTGLVNCLVCVNQKANAYRPALESDVEISRCGDVQEICVRSHLSPERDRKEDIEPVDTARELQRPCLGGVEKFAVQSLSGRDRGSLGGAVETRGRSGEGIMMSVRLREMARFSSLGL